MTNNLRHISRKLDSRNIDKAIKDYNELLQDIPLEIKADNILMLLNELKRGKLKNGPYPGISIFEAANRIMTDLTILYGVRDLLKGAIPSLAFTVYEVEFGNENKNDHDIMAKNSDCTLIGEAFNVAQSFFYTKKSSALKKLKVSSQKNALKLLLFNEDAVPHDYAPVIEDNEYHYAVKIFKSINN